MTSARDISALVRAKRMEKGLSQEGLARLIGCSSGAVHNIEAGRVACPRPHIARGLIEHLGLTAEQVVGVKSQAVKDARSTT